MKNKTCAIHQPNFFPWLGYFDKIKKADVFILLDDVQFAKASKGTWSNRVFLNFNGEKKWFTAPIKRPKSLWKINETEFSDTNWREKLKRILTHNYSKASYFKKYKDFVFNLIDYPSNNLVDFNINTINEICKLLEIDFEKKSIFSSSLEINSSSTQRLIDLTKAVGCYDYMSGDGADGYQDIELFKAQNITLKLQNFEHPTYKQYRTKEFIKGLSIIDSIFNIGNNL